MNVDQSIEYARKLKNHIQIGYAQCMAANIRSSMSSKTANRYREAIKQDKMEHWFLNLETDNPTINPNV